MLWLALRCHVRHFSTISSKTPTSSSPFTWSIMKGQSVAPSSSRCQILSSVWIFIDIFLSFEKHLVFWWTVLRVWSLRSLNHFLYNFQKVNILLEKDIFWMLDCEYFFILTNISITAPCLQHGFIMSLKASVLLLMDVWYF